MLCWNLVIKWSIFFVDVGFYRAGLASLSLLLVLMGQDLQAEPRPGVCLSWKIHCWVASLLSADDVVPMVWNCPKLSYLCLIVAYRKKRFFNKHKKIRRVIMRWWYEGTIFIKEKDIFNSITLHINELVVLERHKRACCCQRLTWWDVTVRGLQFNSTTNISTQGLHSVHSTHNITAQLFFFLVLFQVFFLTMCMACNIKGGFCNSISQFFFHVHAQ